MRQVIRYEVEVFFLKNNLDLAVSGGAGEMQAVALSGCGKPQGVGVQVCPILKRKQEHPLLVLPVPLLFLHCIASYIIDFIFSVSLTPRSPSSEGQGFPSPSLLYLQRLEP